MWQLKRLRTEVAALNKALFDEVSKGERERDRTNQKVTERKPLFLPHGGISGNLAYNGTIDISPAV